MNSDTAWSEMLDEFRALDGIAENICLKEGRFGRGLFPCDPAKPVSIHIPSSLLVELRHVEFIDNQFHVAAEAPVSARERAFLETYERSFSWGVGYHDTAALLTLVHEAPAELRNLLATPLEARRWLAAATPEAAQKSFFASRVISYAEKDVVMPIVELANHGHIAKYDLRTGVGLSGQFSDEILVEYLFSDSLDMFQNWGFASQDEDFALSLPLQLQGKFRRLTVERKTLKIEPGRNPFVPTVTVKDGEVTLSHVMLGHKKYPRLARGIFQKAMREAGWENDANETFDMIQHLNRTKFHELIWRSEEAVPQLGQLLRNVARFQLDAMSYSIGTREI